MLKRILLAEDSAPMREVIWGILARECDGADWVGHGDHVLAKASEVMPDTILLDISLPGASGLSLLPLLREAHPQTNIVMLTNYSDDLYRRESFARGADAYVLKNCANEELLPAIRAGRFRREQITSQTDVV
jgi:DNA-binding response OmpR family regulator